MINTMLCNDYCPHSRLNNKLITNTERNRTIYSEPYAVHVALPEGTVNVDILSQKVIYYKTFAYIVKNVICYLYHSI